MIKASLGALAAVVAVALIAPYLPAQAARYSAPPPPPASSEPGGGGNPNNPGGTDEGDQPSMTSEEKITQLETTCNGALATLVKIPERMVVAFADQNAVNVIPVCNSGLGRAANIDESQALPLQDAISKNPALMAALDAKGFKADDVVGVVLIDGAATLYVHKHT